DLVSCSDTEGEYLQDDPHDPTRKLVRQVLGAISEFERSLIRLRLQRGRALEAEGGPFDREQQAVAMALNLKRKGCSLRQIGVALTEAGFTSKRGGPWHPP